MQKQQISLPQIKSNEKKNKEMKSNAGNDDIKTVKSSEDYLDNSRPASFETSNNSKIMYRREQINPYHELNGAVLSQIINPENPLIDKSLLSSNKNAKYEDKQFFTEQSHPFTDILENEQFS